MLYIIYILLVTGLNSYLYYTYKDKFSLAGIIAGVIALVLNLAYIIYTKLNKEQN